ncbi:hypothetical protein CPB83DRAFT_857412, partial [Crepidotus variabilis]
AISRRHQAQYFHLPHSIPSTQPSFFLQVVLLQKDTPIRIRQKKLRVDNHTITSFLSFL